MKKLIITIGLVMMVKTAVAWYPDYAVLASEFSRTEAFFRPSIIRSMNTEGLGKYFTRIQTEPVDLVFQNPANLGSLDRSELTVNLDRNHREERHYGGIMPQMGYYDSRISKPYFIPRQPESDARVLNPLIQAVFLNPPPDRY